MGNNTFTVIALVFFLIMTGWVAGEIGLTTDVIEPPEQPDEPDVGGGIWGSIEALAGLIAWVFNSVASLFQLLTFQVEGLPTEVSLFIFVPISFGIFYLILVIIRGGAG